MGEDTQAKIRNVSGSKLDLEFRSGEGDTREVILFAKEEVNVSAKELEEEHIKEMTIGLRPKLLVIY
jgi:hypothetical protein